MKANKINCVVNGNKQQAIMDKIMMMRGVYYTRKESPESRNIGVIAQEIENKSVKN